jgi:hypothetical protein
MCATSFLSSPFYPLFPFSDIDEGKPVRIFQMVIRRLRELCQALTITNVKAEGKKGYS